MVQTRSAAKRIHGDDSGLPAETPAEKPLENGHGNNVPIPANDPGREDAVAPKKRRRGKRSELCQLNLDVLFLIAAYIHPIDLLNLARTCKSLRELLMDKSSGFVWKTARQQVRGLPACPADLTEPEYANLVYCARCHGCGKYTTTIFWNVRRRYCPGCRIRQMRTFASCSEIIRKNAVLAIEDVLVKGEYSTRVDRDQAASFMNEYRSSSDKEQFISEKQKQCSAILQHAKKCQAWQKRREVESKKDKKERQSERGQRILERLKENGYSREIGYFGSLSIQRARESDFRTSRPLTDKEWNKIWPEWVKIMENLRSQRLEGNVHQPRRWILAAAFDRYITQPSADAPAFDLHPDAAYIAQFPPFKNIIEGPEESRVDINSFTPAFLEFSTLVAEWRETLNTNLAGLVEVPLHLYAPRAESFKGVEQLHLACALFYIARAGVFDHLEVVLAAQVDHSFPNYYEGGSQRLITDRFDIQFLEEAPYVVHACGLDPSVATVNDMDHRNARLKCLVCEGLTLVMNWRHAMWHAYFCHQGNQTLARLCESPRWGLVDNKHKDAIRTVEQSIEGDRFPMTVRCLLCTPRAGDLKSNVAELASHLRHWHHLKIERNADVQQGAHYAPVGIRDSQSAVLEMVETNGRVTFRVPPKSDMDRKMR